MAIVDGRSLSQRRRLTREEIEAMPDGPIKGLLLTSPGLSLRIGDQVRWVWKIDGTTGKKTYMDGEVVGLYPPKDPITVDTVSNLGRTAHRPADLYLVPKS